MIVEVFRATSMFLYPKWKCTSVINNLISSCLQASTKSWRRLVTKFHQIAIRRAYQVDCCAINFHLPLMYTEKLNWFETQFSFSHHCSRDGGRSTSLVTHCHKHGQNWSNLFLPVAAVSPGKVSWHLNNNMATGWEGCFFTKSSTFSVLKRK